MTVEPFDPGFPLTDPDEIARLLGWGEAIHRGDPPESLAASEPDGEPLDDATAGY